MSAGADQPGLRAQFGTDTEIAERPKMAVEGPLHDAAHPGIPAHPSWRDSQQVEVCGGTLKTTPLRGPTSPASTESLINQTLDEALNVPHGCSFTKA